MKKRVGANQTAKQMYPSLGRLINRLPRCRLLYPLYLADQLFCMRETVLSPRVPAAFDGFTFAFVSDIHFGPLFSERQRERLNKYFGRCGTDTLILGGDYGMNTAYGERFFDAFDLPEHPEGAFAIFGNHEQIGDMTESSVKTMLEAHGIRPLLNERAVISRGEESIALTGFRDYFTSPGPQDDIDPNGGDMYSIFIIHNPDQLVCWERMGKAVSFDLCLCGHTHGGQVALFGHSVVSSCCYGDHYRSGWYRAFGGRVLASNGAGTSKMPVRLGVPAQAHIITLRRSEEDRVTREEERL